MLSEDQKGRVSDTAPLQKKKNSMVPENILESVTETLGCTEEVRAALQQVLAIVGDDPDMLAELPPLLQAQAYLVLAKTVTTLHSVQLRCAGVDPEEHPMSKEFDRLGLCGEKLGRYKDWDKVPMLLSETQKHRPLVVAYQLVSDTLSAPLRPSTKINGRGAARVIGHSLPQLTAEQRESLKNISRGNEERIRSFTDNRARKKRKQQISGPSSVRANSIRQAADDFLQKAAKELVMSTDSDVRGPLRILSDGEEQEQLEQES